MAINFQKGGVYKLKASSTEEAKILVQGFMVSGEEVICAFQTIRDKIIFTNKRIISVDVQGVTGRRKSYASMPYSRIQYYSVQTPGFIEVYPDSELFLMFSDNFTATFEFKDNVDMGMIARIISEYVLR